ncbi:cbb3-type cytochrome c oxidase subunit I [Komagataeibacter rhaeticus]|nr:cbb3-type cytochrome c oxidase subunit I [Komagataeibacter rhaeticus]
MLYLVMAIVAGLAGGLLAVGLQAGLLPQGLLDAWAGGDAAGAADRIARRHGMMMVFFCALPALCGGFGNWFVPLLLRARALAFPRMALAGWSSCGGGFCRGAGGPVARRGATGFGTGPDCLVSGHAAAGHQHGGHDPEHGTDGSAPA